MLSNYNRHRAFVFRHILRYTPLSGSSYLCNMHDTLQGIQNRANEQSDDMHWPGCLGHHGRGRHLRDFMFGGKR